MPFEVITLPCLSDNYAFLMHNPATRETALVDAPEAAAVRNALEERGWGLDRILITHHHSDHIDGVEELRSVYGSEVIGAEADAHRLPKLDVAVCDGGTVSACGEEAMVVDVSGHTVGHIAYLFPGAMFTADSLMALGCGRVFEGTFEMMWNSLAKLAALDPANMIYSGHEYTESNARFALSIEPNNPDLLARTEAIAKARSEGQPTVPSRLSLELATNPFLRARLPEVKELIGAPAASDAESFAEIRRRKDRF